MNDNKILLLFLKYWIWTQVSQIKIILIEMKNVSLMNVIDLKATIKGGPSIGGLYMTLFALKLWYSCKQL